MNEREITDEFITELQTLADWEGCETGDYTYNLLDILESYANVYSSDEFSISLKNELFHLYDSMKANKLSEELWNLENIKPISNEEAKELVLSKLTEEEKKILGL